MSKNGFSCQQMDFCQKWIFLSKNGFICQKWTSLSKHGFFCQKWIFLSKNGFICQKCIFLTKNGFLPYASMDQKIIRSKPPILAWWWLKLIGHPKARSQDEPKVWRSICLQEGYVSFQTSGLVDKCPRATRPAVIFGARFKKINFKKIFGSPLGAQKMSPK